MTGTEPLHRQELLELAALEAYGLLDEYESALFNRTFHNAPASVQQEIVKLQEQLAADTSILPHEEPREALRDRVLAAVNQAIEQETPGPIASIGRRTAAELAEASEQPTTGLENRLAGTGQFWRAASFFLVAGLIVMSYFLTMTVQHNYELTKRALENNTGAQVEQLIGPTFKDFFWKLNREVTVVHFEPTNSGARHHAVLLIHEEQKQAFLVTEHMPDLGDDQLLTLRVQDDRGHSNVLVQFEGKDRLGGWRVELDGIGMGSDMRWEITGPDGVIMRA